MANSLWDKFQCNEITAERIRSWVTMADVNNALLIMDLTKSQITDLSSTPGLDGVEIYESLHGTCAGRWISERTRALEDQRIKEHRELLLILQEALIDISQRDADLASKLAARAYVNLKTDSAGQRRYDGLLHRFTGVLHRRSRDRVGSTHSDV